MLSLYRGMTREVTEWWTGKVTNEPIQFEIMQFGMNHTTATLAVEITDSIGTRVAVSMTLPQALEVGELLANRARYLLACEHIEPAHI